jgi:hypothetical protein
MWPVQKVVSVVAFSAMDFSPFVSICRNRFVEILRFLLVYHKKWSESVLITYTPSVLQKTFAVRWLPLLIPTKQLQRAQRGR